MKNFPPELDYVSYCVTIHVLSRIYPLYFQEIFKENPQKSTATLGCFPSPSRFLTQKAGFLYAIAMSLASH